MLREEARVWSIKFPAAPESTNAVDIVHEGQSTRVMDTKKSLAESDGRWNTHSCPMRWKIT
jgi:hypothetical protein